MTPRRLLLALLILVGVLLLATPILVLLMQRADVGVAPSPSVAAQPTANEAWSAQPITEIDQAVWWRTGWRALDDIDSGHDFSRLTVGRFDGEMLGEIDLGAGWAARGSGPPFIVGPEMGFILYTRWEERAAELHLVDTNAREDRVLVTRRGLHHAALAPASGYAYFAATAPEPGIWRVRLDGDHEPELVAEPPEVVGLRTDAVLTAPVSALPKQVTLLLDEAESRLAIYTCSDSCLLRVIDLSTGGEFEVGADAQHRELIDFVGDVVVIDGGAAYDVEAREPVATPEGARLHVFQDVGWELPEGFRVEERPVDPDAQLSGLTHYVLIDPGGAETPVDAMGQGVGQG